MNAIMTPAMPATLSDEESARLTTLEKLLERSFVDRGRAIKEIRDGRLYRVSFNSFDDYCKRRLLMSRPRAYQLIAAAEVAVNLSTLVDIAQPMHERQVRQLARLSPSSQRDVWSRAVKDAAGQPAIDAIGRLVQARRESGRKPRDVYQRIERLAERCRKLHQPLFADPTRANTALEMYLAVVCARRSLPWP